MNYFLSFFIAFAISIIAGRFIIRSLKKFQFGQSIREDGPQSHQKKSGTPTLGGVIFMLGATISVLLFSDLSFETTILLVLTLGYGLIGFLDDYIKIKFKRNLGLTAKQKLAAQFVLSVIVFVLLKVKGIDTTLSIPMTDLKWDLGWFYLPFLLFLIIGTTNATNLTDGLDGLLAGTSSIAFAGFAVIAWQTGASSIVVFSLAMIGGILAFLIYNCYPAVVFMGDTGSLAIGGALVGISVLLKAEILLAIMGIVFVFETLSVILQVGSFKLRKKRLFKMAPLHHHFELTGWKETKVVKVFCLVGFLFSALGVAIWTL